MSNLSPGAYAQSLSQGTIKIFSDSITQELENIKAPYRIFLSKMQGTEYIIRNYKISGASTRAMENGKFRPLASAADFADANAYFNHLREFEQKADSPMTKSRKMTVVGSERKEMIDKVANLDIGLEITRLAKDGSSKLIQLRDARCAIAMTAHAFASDNTFLKYDIKNNIVPLSTPMITQLGMPKIISPFAQEISYERCLETLKIITFLRVIPTMTCQDFNIS